MGVSTWKKITESCIVLFLIKYFLLRNLCQTSSRCVFGYFLYVYFPQFFIQLDNWSKGNIFLILLLQNFFCLEIIICVLFLYCRYKCILGRLENINGFFLFHLQIDFCEESLCVLLLFDHSTVLKEILPVSKVIGLELNSLFLCWPSGYRWGSTFDEIDSFKSFTGSILIGLIALIWWTNGKEIIIDGTVFHEPWKITNIRLLPLSLVLVTCSNVPLGGKDIFIRSF